MLAIRATTGSGAADTQTACSAQGALDAAGPRSRARNGPWRCAAAARPGDRPPPGRRCGGSSRPAPPCWLAALGGAPAAPGEAATKAASPSGDTQHVAAREALAQDAARWRRGRGRPGRGRRPRAPAPPSPARRRGCARRRAPTADSKCSGASTLATRLRSAGAGSSSGSGCVRAAPPPGAPGAPRTSSAVSSGATARGQRQADAPSRRASATSGTCSDAGANPSHAGDDATVGGEGEAPDGHQSRCPAGRRRRRPPRRRRQRASARAAAANRSGPASIASALPRAASALPSRSGCSKQNSGSAGPPGGEGDRRGVGAGAPAPR